MIEKVIIIGSGPAGLSAATYASREGFEPLVFAGSRGGGQLELTTIVENFPGFPDGINGPEIVKLMKKQEIFKGVKLLPSGHIMGSRQLYVESDNSYSLLYSGDFQTDVPVLAEKIQTKEADILIIDSTYPEKDIKFDDKKEVALAMQSYVLKKLDKGIVLFGAYSLGKAQDIIKILNDIGIVPIVDKKIHEINAVYAKYNINLSYASIYKNEDEFDLSIKRNFVGIVENSRLNSLAVLISKAYSKKVFTAVATGFAKMYNLNTDVQFPLSDHADFFQTKEYIEQCSPKLIYTFGRGSNPSILARNLSECGYNAHRFISYKESLLDSVKLNIILNKTI